MPIDRPLALRNAEKLLRQGKLDAAIAEYLRVVEDQPRDWSTANVLGDLYLRAGQTDKGIAQFARIADSLSREGFVPKAAALYKKILRIRPDDEHACLQAGELAAGQGVLVDARAYFSAVAERRLARGDREGAAEIRLRLASLDPSDFDARRGAARTRVAHGDVPGAMRDFKAIAADLADQGRQAEAMATLREAAELDPNDREVLDSLFARSLAAGDLEAAERWATTDDRLQQLAQAKLLRGAPDEALSLFRRLLNHAPARSQEIARLGCEIARSVPDAGFAVVDIAAETSVIEGDWPAAAAVLQEFVAQVPDHIPALMRLVEICVDGGLASTLNAAESQLADAYLAAGVGAEARVIAEDLIARCPAEQSHVDQLRRALVMLGERDPDRIIAERLSETPDDAGTRTQVDAPPVPGAPAADDAIEIDLSDLLGDVPLASGQDGGADYQRGVALRDDGRIEESIQAFEAASRQPGCRFAAAAAAARLHRQRGDLIQAVDWFEIAAEAQAATPADTHALLYDLADALESLGEGERALAVYLELQTDAGVYRDVAARISRLTKVQARG